jgi:pathogenesis-related protein 1
MAIGTGARFVGLLIFCLVANAASAETPQAMLSAHNTYRSKHCVPALTWSAQLAAAAQDWANGCKRDDKDPKKFAHSKVPGEGENLAWGTGLSIKGAVDLWYSEISKYNFAVPVWSNEVGHFTQVVWRSSAQLGCAAASCSGQTYWVCRYAPPGNFNVDTPGQLAQNVLAPDCQRRIESVPLPPPGFNPGPEPAPPASRIESVPLPRGDSSKLFRVKP